ncbi:hypothetical protein ARSEF4850_009641 [Beauveria asiatica]
MVQSTRWQGQTRDPKPAVDASEPPQVELFLDTGRDMLADSGQVTRLFAIQCGQQRQKPVALASARDGVFPEELDGEGRCLFADASAQTRRDGEIIAVPGLGAHPYHTWEARKTPRPSVAESQSAQSAKVPLLKDLLARDFPDARIWNFAHDSNWLIDAPVKTTAEIGKCLITEIKDKRSSPHLPIIFIGHSLGGIIIKQALCGSDSQDIVDATAGIIFLGTPHQGSSVSVAGAVLASVTGILGSDTTLLLSLQNHDAQLSNLADVFGSRIAPNERRPQKVPIISFYETKKTYLLGLSLGVVYGEGHGEEGDSEDGIGGHGEIPVLAVAKNPAGEAPWSGDTKGLDGAASTGQRRQFAVATRQHAVAENPAGRGSGAATARV